MTNLPICKVLQKHDIPGQMVHCVVELFEFDMNREDQLKVRYMQTSW